MMSETAVTQKEIFRLDPATVPGPVHLNVANIERSLSFYADALGLEPGSSGETVTLSPRGGLPLIRLTANPAALPKPPQSTGLYHYAILLPSRRDLGMVLRRLFEARYAVQGASDHGVSEAIYLADPDGNGMEIYRDRPQSEWPVENGRLSMVTEPFDADGVLGEVTGNRYQWGGLPHDACIGHVHLHVSELEQAERFYTEVLGLELMQRYPPGSHGGARPSAAFLSAGGYHHHVGINTWAGVGAPPPPDSAVGLRYFTLVLPSGAALQEKLAHITQLGVAVEERPEGYLVRDPSQNRVMLTAT